MAILATEAVSTVTRSPRTVSTRKVNIVRWGTVLAALLIWEVLCDGPFSNGDYITAPSRILTVGLASILQPETLLALGQTTSRFLAAFAIVAVLGTVIGLVLGRVHRQIFNGARDVVTVLYALPLVPFYPLFVLWLGLGMRSEIAFGAIHGLIPVILITMTASAHVDSNLVASSDSMGAGPVARLRLVILPAILPEVLGGLKIGAALSLLGVLLGELMISVDGVGSFILNQITNKGAAPLDAMIVVVCAGVVLVNGILSLIERRTSRWRTASVL